MQNNTTLRLRRHDYGVVQAINTAFLIRALFEYRGARTNALKSARPNMRIAFHQTKAIERLCRNSVLVCLHADCLEAYRSTDILPPASPCRNKWGDSLGLFDCCSCDEVSYRNVDNGECCTTILCYLRIGCGKQLGIYLRSSYCEGSVAEHC